MRQAPSSWIDISQGSAEMTGSPIKCITPPTDNRNNTIAASEVHCARSVTLARSEASGKRIRRSIVGTDITCWFNYVALIRRSRSTSGRSSSGTSALGRRIDVQMRGRRSPSRAFDAVHRSIMTFWSGHSHNFDRIDKSNHGTTMSGAGVTGDAPMLERTFTIICLTPRDSRETLMLVLSRPHEN